MSQISKLGLTKEVLERRLIATETELAKAHRLIKQLKKENITLMEMV